MLRISGFTKKIVVTKNIDIGDAGLASDLFEHRTREDLGAEDGLHFGVPYLSDQIANFARGRFVEIRRLNGAHNYPSVVGGKVGVGVVIGEESAIFSRQSCARCCNGCIKCIEFACVGGRI